MNLPSKKLLSLLFLFIFISLMWFGFSQSFGSPQTSRTALQDLLDSDSQRKTGAQAVVVSEPGLAIIATPVAAYHDNGSLVKKPLLVEGQESTTNFLSLYPCEPISISGDRASASTQVAGDTWEWTDGAIVIDDGRLDLGIALAPLASYVNIPIIIANSSDTSYINSLKVLDVQFTIASGSMKGVGRVHSFDNVMDCHRLVLDFIAVRLGEVDYITLANTMDTNATFGLPALSMMAPYLSVCRGGFVVSSPYMLLPQSTDFEGTDGSDINPYTEVHKDRLNRCIKYMKLIGLYDHYTEESPYLAVLGGPHSLPFYYTEGGGYAITVTDDYYADLDEDMFFVELACGRPIALTVQGTSAVISRSIFYNQYMQNWVADSTVTNAMGAEWKSTAYVAKGDDWNGAIWAMSPEYWDCLEYFHDQGYSVVTTKRHQTGGSVAQDRLKLYTSSSFIYVMAHGYPEGYQNIDMIHSSDVKEWGIMGPSAMILTSCSAARMDIPNIEDAIGLTFMDVGTIAYVGGTRTESAGASPYISIESILSLVGNNQSLGIAHRDSKNIYNENNAGDYYHSGIKQMYGDPALNPYTDGK